MNVLGHLNIRRPGPCVHALRLCNRVALLPSIDIILLLSHFWVQRLHHRLPANFISFIIIFNQRREMCILLRPSTKESIPLRKNQFLESVLIKLDKLYAKE